MKIYQPSRDDDQPAPSSADVKEFARRLQQEREDATRRPHMDDDAWHWFLSLFSERGNDKSESDGRISRWAA